jgi:hypothetical protein
MKVLGVKQFKQKKFKLLDLKNSKFKGILGNVPKFFTAVIYGFSGQGKTEFSLQLVKELSRFGRVLWLSYEQRHGYDLQSAIKRNKMTSGKLLVSDPIANLAKDVSLMQDLDNYLSKPKSPEYVVIDSLDYTEWGFKEYTFLKNKYFNKKGFIFLAHASKQGLLKKRISEKIMFDGGIGIFVKNFIAWPIKNRFGGFTEKVVYQDEARLRNPIYFAKKEQ